MRYFADMLNAEQDIVHDVFISYSSIDKNAADTVCSVLEQNGISCWMAPGDITPGLDFAEAIIDGIKSSKLFILLFSSNSNNSKQVIREVDRAVHAGLPVVNLRLEDVPLSKQLEYYLSSVHWLDAMTPPLEQHLDQLCGVVKILLRKDDTKDDELEKAIRNGTLRMGKDATSIASSGRSRWKKAVVPAAIIGVILVAALLIVSPLLKQKISLRESARDKSIAVLPFTNLSNDPEQEYFVEGMHDEILDRIFKIGDLKVISRTSSMRYKNSDLPRSDEAIKHIEKAIELDPYSSLVWGLYGAHLGYVRRYEEAIEAVLKSKELDPTQPVGTINYFLYFLGKEEEAFREFRKNFSKPEYLQAVDDGYAEGGYRGAHKRVADLRVEKAKDSYMPPVTIANNYAIAGEFEQALYWLEKAYEERAPGLPYAPGRPWYDEIREDPRFRDLCRRMNLPYK